MRDDETRLRRRGYLRRHLLEEQLLAPRVDSHRVALAELSFEKLERKRVLEQPLDRTLERPRAVGGIPARLREDLLRLVRDLELDLALREPLAQPPELELDDLGELLAGQRLAERKIE